MWLQGTVIWPAMVQDVTENMLQVDGRASTIHYDTQEYENAEEMKVLMPWNGESDCLIDRFDARSSLDFYREPKASATKVAGAEDLEVEEVCSLVGGIRRQVRQSSCLGRALPMWQPSVSIVCGAATYHWVHFALCPPDAANENVAVCWERPWDRQPIGSLACCFHNSSVHMQECPLAFRAQSE
jgi:hypothetical protein